MALKRFLTLFLLMITLGGCSNGCAGVSYAQHTNYINESQNVAHLQNSVVDFVTPDLEQPGQFRSFCSGFFVNETTIASANHCVAEHVQIVPGLSVQLPTIIGQRVLYMTFDQQPRPGYLTTVNPRIIVPHLARVVGFDEENDVTILEIDSREPHATNILIMNDSVPVVGREVFVCGNPGSLTWILTHGIISSVTLDSTGDVESFMSNTNIFFGNSGSAIVNDHGEVIGIADKIAYQQSYLGIYVPIKFVLRLILQQHQRMSM